MSKGCGCILYQVEDYFLCKPNCRNRGITRSICVTYLGEQVELKDPSRVDSAVDHGPENPVLQRLRALYVIQMISKGRGYKEG